MLNPSFNKKECQTDRNKVSDLRETEDTLCESFKSYKKLHSIYIHIEKLFYFTSFFKKFLT